MSPGLSASAPRWSGWRRAISAGGKLEPQSGERAEEELAKRPGFRSFRCQQSSLLAFEFEGIHHSDLVTLLAESGIALRAGQHCAQPLLAALGVSGTLRASFAPTIPKTMLRRWSTRWIAPRKFWWINDNSAPLRHNHYRRYAAPDLRPAEPVGG